MNKACRKIIDGILDNKIKTRHDLENAKRQICKEFNLNKFMTNSEILEYVSENEKDMVIKILQKKPTRTISGVAIVAIMCHPHQCPHGRCSYCPESTIAPPSYTGEEPAALRARMYDFDPYKQSYNRLKQLYSIGHPIDKVELIIMGGTFPSRDLSYQDWFISRSLTAMNDLSEELKNSIGKKKKYGKNSENGENTKNIKNSENTENSENAENSKINIYDTVKHYYPNDYVILEDVQRLNEKSKIRCIGITFETRPDYCKIEDIDRMLNFGVTRVELGVQTTYDFIYRKIKRGHSVADVVESTRLLKDSGEKVAYHLMPGLLSDMDMDMRIFKRVFNDSKFKPDMLKIYPTLITKGSELYNEYKEGKYTPYSDEEAVDLIVKIKKILPKWVRTMRIQRDIPSTLIEAGVKKSNLGELVYKRLEEENINCKCIRCREIGHKMKNPKFIEKINDLNLDDFKIFKEEYDASEGKEIFLSYENKIEDVLAGFLRLRLPSDKAHRKEVDSKTGIIRELHVYGNMIQIGDKNQNIGQHLGFGEKLIKNAEKIAIKNNKDKIIITSGIGARNYYKKFKYERLGPYMAKNLL